jgi:hypothetical protein
VTQSDVSSTIYPSLSKVNECSRCTCSASLVDVDFRSHIRTMLLAWHWMTDKSLAVAISVARLTMSWSLRLVGKEGFW